MYKKATLLLTLTLSILLIPYALCGDYVQVEVDWEPKDCGEVVLEPPGGNYSIGTQISVTARPLESCKFSRWITNLPGLNNTITTPLYVTIFSNAYFKALFVKVQVREGETTTSTTETYREYVFVKISANMSSFKEEVKTARIGESVWISAPREIHLNDTARYVFVGWGGDVSINTTEPMARITVTGDTHVIALYKLYMRFLELWYPVEEFTYFHAPIIDVGQGVRMNPKTLRVSFANITIPLNTPIPREFISAIEPIYVKEYSLSIRCLGCGELNILLNGKPFKLSEYMSGWFEEGSTVTLRILDVETPKAWILSPREYKIVMDNPKNQVIECEEKPHAWSYGSPLYTILQQIVAYSKNIGLYPFIANIISSPPTAYALIASIFGGLAGIAYGLTILFKKASMLRSGLGESIEKLIARRAEQPEKILDVIPRIRRVEREFKIIDSSFPEINLPIGNPNPARLHEEEVKPKIEVEGESPVKVDLKKALEMIEEGAIDANMLISIIEEKPSTARRMLMRGPRVSGEPKIDGVEEVLEKLHGSGAVVLYGGDKYIREYIVQKLGIDSIRLDVSVRNVDEAWRTIQKFKVKGGAIVLGEEVDDESFKNILYVARLMESPIIKLSVEEVEGMENVQTKTPSIFKLFGYIVYKILATGIEMGLKDAVELARIARGARGYITIDRYFQEVSGKKIDIKGFEAEENKLSFTDEELEALAIWMRSGKPEEAIEHYRNIVSQLDPSGYIRKLKSFRERLESLSSLNVEVAMLRRGVLEGVEEREGVKTEEGHGLSGSREKREEDLDWLLTEIEEQEFEDEEFEEGGEGGEFEE
ncbi:MAG: hypothetical protein QXI68_01170 [Sulfolobales archaeon]